MASSEFLLTVADYLAANSSCLWWSSGECAPVTTKMIEKWSFISIISIRRSDFVLDMAALEIVIAASLRSASSIIVQRFDWNSIVADYLSQ